MPLLSAGVDADMAHAVPRVWCLDMHDFPKTFIKADLVLHIFGSTV